LWGWHGHGLAIVGVGRSPRPCLSDG
jgi:hypothetical protein